MYEGKKYVEREGEYLGRISVREYGRLCHLLQKMDIKSFEDSYHSPEFHGTSVVIRVSMEGGEEKVILDYGQWAPVDLWSLQKTIDAISNDIEWKAVDESSLITARELGHAGRVQDLIAQGAAIKEAFENGGTPLMVAALEGNASPVRVLLDAGADPTAEMEGLGNVLLLAALGGDAETTHAILDAGGEPPAETRHGVTVLMAAAMHGHKEICRHCSLKARTRTCGSRKKCSTSSPGGPLSCLPPRGAMRSS